MQEQDLGNTQFFNVESELETGVKVVLYTVYEALVEKGYNPVNQIVGYIMSSTSNASMNICVRTFASLWRRSDSSASVNISMYHPVKENRSAFRRFQRNFLFRRRRFL